MSSPDTNPGGGSDTNSGRVLSGRAKATVYIGTFTLGCLAGYGVYKGTTEITKHFLTHGHFGEQPGISGPVTPGTVAPSTPRTEKPNPVVTKTVVVTSEAVAPTTPTDVRSIDTFDCTARDTTIAGPANSSDFPKKLENNKDHVTLFTPVDGRPAINLKITTDTGDTAKIKGSQNQPVVLFADSPFTVEELGADQTVQTACVVGTTKEINNNFAKAKADAAPQKGKELVVTIHDGRIDETLVPAA